MVALWIGFVIFMVLCIEAAYHAGVYEGVRRATGRKPMEVEP